MIIRNKAMPSKTLRQGLDREVIQLFHFASENSTQLTFPQVYQIVRKLADEQIQYDDGVNQRLSVPTVYDKIKRSNSSLNRKSKRILEDSIERVLELLKEEAASEDEVGSIDGNFDGIESFETSVQVSLFSLKRLLGSSCGIEYVD